MYFPEANGLDYAEDHTLNDDGIHELALTVSWLEYRGQFAYRVDANLAKELHTYSFVWDLPDKNTLRSRILKGPPDLSDKMGFNLVTMQARAATGLLERVFPAPNSEPEPNTSSTAAAPATASVESSPLTSLDSSPEPSAIASTRTVTGACTRSRFLHQFKDGTLTVGRTRTINVSASGNFKTYAPFSSPSSIRLVLQFRSKRTSPIQLTIILLVGELHHCSITRSALLSKACLMKISLSKQWLRFFCRLAEEYRQHFDSEAEYKSLVSGFERLRTPVKTKTGADVIFINVQRYRLIHKTADTSSGSREGSAVAVRRGDPFYDLYLPRLCDILFSLNKTLRISHDEIEDEDTLVQEFDDVISSRALCALLYYPVSHRLEAKNYEESLAIADRWLDILSNCYP